MKPSAIAALSLRPSRVGTSQKIAVIAAIHAVAVCGRRALI
jgi:hypothetical protein